MTRVLTTETAVRRTVRDASRVPLSRIAWLVTVAASLITALLLLVSDYNGYALLAVAVGLSAAINLR